MKSAMRDHAQADLARSSDSQRINWSRQELRGDIDGTVGCVGKPSRQTNGWPSRGGNMITRAQGIAATIFAYLRPC